MSNISVSTVTGTPILQGETADAVDPDAAGVDHDPLSKEAARKLSNLTSVEIGIIALMIDGNSPEEIAAALGIRNSTMEFELKTLYGKLGVACEFELILFALYHRLMDT